MMIHISRTSLAAALGVAGLAALLAWGHGTADAQSKATPKISSDPPTHSAASVNTIFPVLKNDRVEDVVPFPNSSIFLVVTRESVIVWERRGADLVTLLAIEPDATVKDIVILDDNETFIVQTINSASVYRITRNP